MRRGVRRMLLTLALLASLGVLAAGGVVLWAHRTLTTPFPPAESGVLPREVEIAPGSSATAILRQLEAAGVIARADLAGVLVRVHGHPALQAGEYRFERPASTREVLERLIAGDVVQHPITVVEGLTLEETAALLADRGFGDEQVFLAAMRRTDLIADLDPLATTLEGYLFPDTYAFPRGTPEERIVEQMVANFRRRWESLVAARGAPGEVRSTVILASIVEREVTRDDERPVVAGVYENRLRLGMALYADPTVIYALKIADRWDGNLRRVDFELDSPFNTYRYSGLPPGPICSPGTASLRAAAEPADVPFLYFVSRNDGTHVFAETLAEHNRNVETWQRQYFRDRRRTAAAPADPPPGG